MKQLKIIASAGALLLVSLQAHAGDIISSVVSTTTEFKVVNSAEATVSVSARKDLAAGSVSGELTVGTWSGSVNAGTLAYRINRAVNPADSVNSTNPTVGVASNSTDSSKKLAFFVNYQTEVSSSSQIIDGWRVMNQGVTAISSNIRTLGGRNQVLLAGRYPIAIDVASYAF
ncbi:hypothetical protein [Serratia marcescens]|uniref:hypothetical protein n=1 Tax=Serratia marcescens TaxID=615 RepID=UPI003D0212C0